MLSRLYLIPERYGQTDIQTDGQNCYINAARQYADARQQSICCLLFYILTEPLRLSMFI